MDKRFWLKLSLCISAFFITSSSFADMPYDDKDFACTAQAKADQYKRDFNINLSSFGGMELCKASVDTKKLFNDLEIVEKGEFGTGTKNVFIRDFVNPQNYYSWLKQMTRGIRRGHDIPWATAYNSGGYFTMQDGWTKLSTLGRVGTVIHEARHTEGYGHGPCAHGPYSDTGLSGCDDSVPEGGSHGVEMEYYSRVVLQGRNFHPVYKSMARLMNLGRANFVFNELPMVQREALVALSGPQALVVDAKETVQVPLPELTGATLKRTSAGATLLKDNEAYALDLYASEQGESKINDDFSYFKLLKMPYNVKPIDLEEYDVGEKRYLIGLDANEKVYSFVFSEGQWSEGVRIPGAKALINTSPDGQSGAFVVKADGSICVFNAERMNCQAENKSKWPDGVVGYAHYNNDLLELLDNGQIQVAGKKTPFERLKDVKVYQMVTVPLYDSFGL